MFDLRLATGLAVDSGMSSPHHSFATSSQEEGRDCEGEGYKGGEEGAGILGIGGGSGMMRTVLCLLHERGAILLRHERHHVYRLPIGQKWVMPKTASDWQAWKNMVGLKRVLHFDFGSALR